MIKFTTDDKILRVDINDGVGGIWYFKHAMSHKSEAIICSKHFEKELENRIKSIRKQAYEDGYKDGKQKQKKISDFCPCMSRNITGWK